MNPYFKRPPQGRGLTAMEKIEWRVMPEPNSGCWLWLSSLGTDGYGSANINGIKGGAHRVAWIIYKGEIPPGLHVCHKCDNRICVNPDHLFIGTPGDNIQDMMRKGRNVAPRGTRSAHAKINEEIVRKIRSEGGTLRQKAAKYGVCPQQVHRILKGERWAHVK